MIDAPQTLKEARAYKYGQGVYNPGGRQYVSYRCAYEVYGGLFFRQCNRKNSYGPDRLYCRQHAKMVEKQQDEIHAL